MAVHVLLFDAGSENEGIHSLELNGTTVVLLFEDKDDAERYAGLLEKRFVSQAALADDIGAKLGLGKTLLAVKNTRNIGKADMILNAAIPQITVNPETYEVRADGELLTCEPATELPLAQRYFLF